MSFTTTRTSGTLAAATIIGWIVGLVIGFLWLAFASYIVVINANDIINTHNGQFAFWPVLWIILVLSLTWGGATKAAS